MLLIAGLAGIPGGPLVTSADSWGTRPLRSAPLKAGGGDPSFPRPEHSMAVSHDSMAGIHRKEARGTHIAVNSSATTPGSDLGGALPPPPSSKPRKNPPDAAVQCGMGKPPAHTHVPGDEWTKAYGEAGTNQVHRRAGLGRRGAPLTEKRRLIFKTGLKPSAMG